MKGRKALMSKADSSWNTPKEVMDIIKEHINITLDCASSDVHAACDRFITPDLDDEWTAWREQGLWINPPYSPTKLCYRLVQKVIQQAKIHEIPAVILIPARTDTALWQELIFPNCTVLFKKGRIKFVPSYKVFASNIYTKEIYEEQSELNSATFPSAFCFVNVDAYTTWQITNKLNTPETSVFCSTMHEAL